MKRFSRKSVQRFPQGIASKQRVRASDRAATIETGGAMEPPVDLLFSSVDDTKQGADGEESAVQFGGDLGDALALEFRAFEFLGRRLAGTVGVAGRGHAVGGAAAHDIVAQLRLVGIGQRYDDHAVMLQQCLRGDQGEFGATVLGRGRGHDRADLVDQRALDRKSTRLNSSHVSQSRMPSSA